MKHTKLGLLTLLVSFGAQAEVSVLSSFSILGDVAKQIGGERVKVENLVGADQDSHAYHLTPKDVQKIRQADLILLNGLGLEKTELVRAVEQSKVPHATVAKGIKALPASEEHHHDHDHHDHDHEHDHDHGEFDPHVWNDPVLMQQYAANVTKALMKVDPAGKAYYKKRFNSYSQQLKKLHVDVSKVFSAIPENKRKVLTGHDAFNYMGKRYKITFLAPQGVSTEAESSAKQVAAIIRQMKRQGIKAVFIENIKDQRMVNRIAEETGAKVSGKLYSDALSRDREADTYLKMYRANVKALSNAMK